MNKTGLETVILRGPTRVVRQFSDRISAERGVRHGSLNLVPADREQAGHVHYHLHSHPKS